MKKLLSFLALITFISFIIFIQSCKEENPVTPTPPSGRPTYEGSGTVGPEGAIVRITNPNSPIKGAYVDIPSGALSSNTFISLSQASSTIKYLPDTTALIIHLQPAGLIFNKLVTIGIPYKSQLNPNLLKAGFLESTNYLLEQLPINEIDQSNKRVIINSNHFSYYLVFDDGTQAEVDMFKKNGMISVNVLMNGFWNNQNIGLAGIPSLPWTWFAGLNAKQ